MRRVVVTGANKGIGLAIAAAILAEHTDTVVFLGSRSEDRGQAAREGLIASHPDRADRIEVLQLDVTSNDSVRRAVEQVADRGPLYGVVNNAGIAAGDMQTVLAVNTFGVRRVCGAFLPLLQPSGRIVTVSSASGPSFVSGCSPKRRRTFVDPDIEWSTLEAIIAECLSIEGDEASFAARGLGSGKPYGLSKALVNAYTVLLARENPHLRINACTPGFIETDLTRPFAATSGRSPAEMGMKSPGEGARSSMSLLFGELEGNGRFYGSDARRSPLDQYRSPGTPAYTGD